MSGRFNLLWVFLLGVTIVWQLPLLERAGTVNRLALCVSSVAKKADTCSTRVDGSLTGSSGNARRLALLSLMARAHGQQEKSIDYLERAVQSSNVRPAWWFQLADLYHQKRESERAWKALEHIENVEHLILSYCKHATIQSDIQDMKRWCSMIARLEPPAVEANCLLGEYYIKTEQSNKAKLAFKRAVTQYNVSDDCLYQYGRYLQEQRKYEDALSYYERAFEKRQLPSYLRAQASIYVNTNRLDKALAVCQQAYDLSWNMHDRADGLACKGNIYFWQYENYEQAGRYFEAAIEEYAAVDVSVYLKLARSERYLGNVSEAIKRYQQLNERLRGRTFMLQWRHEYASYLVELGMETRAREVYRGILQDAPDDPDAKRYLGR